MTDLLEKALKTILPQSGRIAVYHAYGRHGRTGNLLDGLEEVKELRAKGALRQPILIYGFDPEERIRAQESGSILDAPGVFYLRLPALLSEIEATVEKAVRAQIPSGRAIDEKSLRDYAVKEIRAFKHRLDNVCASMEMNANRARKELERSPCVMPRALLEIKTSTIQNLLTECGELKDPAIKIGIKQADKVLEMMNELLWVTRQIEDKATAPSDALHLAFRGVELGRVISDILEQAKEL